MDFLSRFISWIFDAGDDAATAETEAFLAQAVDLSDLERRMRLIDLRRRTSAFGLGD